MRTFILIFVLFFEVGFTATQRLTLLPGHQKTLQVDSLSRVSIGNPKVADVEVLSNGSQVLLTGLSVGKTDLMLWDSDERALRYKIRVKGNARSSIAVIRKKLQDIPKLKINHAQGKVFLQGELFKNKDSQAVLSLEQRYPNIINLTRFNPQTLKLIAHKVKKAFQRAGYPYIEVYPKRSLLALSGEVARQKDVHAVRSLAELFYHRIDEQLTVSGNQRPLIVADIKFVEVQKNKLDDIGLNLPQQINLNQGLRLSAGRRGYQGQMSGIDATLNLLSQKGAARVISNPSLLLKHQKPASFLAGGEIPIRLISERSASISYKAYGIQLKLKADIKKSKKVDLDIQIKVSDIDASLSIEGIPATVEHNINTSASLNIGETIALGGLYQQRDRKSVKKTPFFGHLPVIGELFKSRSFQKNKTEFVVLLTPKNGGTGSYRQNQFRKRYQRHLKQKESYRFSLTD